MFTQQADRPIHRLEDVLEKLDDQGPFVERWCLRDCLVVAIAARAPLLRRFDFPADLGNG